MKSPTSIYSKKLIKMKHQEQAPSLKQAPSPTTNFVPAHLKASSLIKLKFLTTACLIGLLAISAFNISACSSAKARSYNDIATFLRKSPEPLQTFKVEDNITTTNAPLTYEKLKSFSTHAKLCSYGLPEYALTVAAEYKESLDPINPHYLLLQKQLYDKQYRQCLALMKFRATPPLIDHEALAASAPTSNQAEQSQTVPNQAEPNQAKSIEPVSNASQEEANVTPSSNTNDSKVPKPVLTQSNPNQNVTVASLNRYTLAEYQKAYQALKDTEILQSEEILKLIDAYYALGNNEEAEYWITVYHTVEYQNRRADIKLGRHLFATPATQKIGYGILVNYVRMTGNLARLRLLNRPEFVAYREAHPELQSQYDRLERELEEDQAHQTSF